MINIFYKREGFCVLSFPTSVFSIRALLQFEKDRYIIESFGGFIEKFSLFSNRCEAQFSTMYLHSTKGLTDEIFIHRRFVFIYRGFVFIYRGFVFIYRGFVFIYRGFIGDLSIWLNFIKSYHKSAIMYKP